MTVDCAGVSRHAPEIESVVYFCCLDAIRGAAERAGPDSAITVRVTETDDVLRFAVVHTGRQLPVRATNGWGADAIRERVHAVDGAVEIGPYAGGGTTVTGEIPTAR
jgi:signal transduction histidine kinase